jgi:protein phosphatase
MLIQGRPPFQLTIAGETHIGARRANEDHYGYDEALRFMAIADGASSRSAGRVAAEAAVAALFEYETDLEAVYPFDPRERMERAFAFANRRVRAMAADDATFRGMATTLSCVLEIGHHLIIGHVGDSRVSLFRDGRLERLTWEHRVGRDPAGAESRSQAAATREFGLARAIGLAEAVTVDARVEKLLPNDGILLATDGLTDVVDDDAVLGILQCGLHPRATVEELVRAALSRGAPGNVTAVYALWRPVAL